MRFTISKCLSNYNNSYWKFSSTWKQWTFLLQKLIEKLSNRSKSMSKLLNSREYEGGISIIGSIIFLAKKLKNLLNKGCSSG